MRVVFLWVALGACTYHAPGGSPGDAGGDDDAAVATDTPVDHDPSCDSFSDQFDTCSFAPTTAFNPGSSKIYDTGTHTLADFPGGGNPVVLNALQQIDVGGKAGTINVMLVTTFQLSGGKTLKVVGPKPFGILATGDVTVDGTIDATSDATTQGAGARDAVTCAMQTPQPAGNHVGGAAGGGGGAYQGKGGRGQDSDNNEGGATGVSGGVAAPLPRGPLGGCPGGNGGSNTGMGAAQSNGGRGGGVVYITSATKIVVHATGIITAGGGGGRGGNQIDGGGAGGGSGGMILLEAPAVTVDGTLAANGGGGGGGAGGSGAGQPGGSGAGSATAAATGGAASSPGGAGATGSVGGTLQGTDNLAARPGAGGGGGGGGAGVTSIKSTATALNGKFSPPLVTLPP